MSHLGSFLALSQVSGKLSGKLLCKLLQTFMASNKRQLIEDGSLHSYWIFGGFCCLYLWGVPFSSRNVWAILPSSGWFMWPLDGDSYQEEASSRDATVLIIHFFNFLMITSTSFHWAVTSWLTQWEMTASSYPRRRQPFPPTGTDLQRRITSHVHSSNWFYSAFSLVVVSEAYRLVWLNCCSSVFSYTFSFLFCIADMTLRGSHLSQCSGSLCWSLWKFQPCSQTNSTSF